MVARIFLLSLFLVVIAIARAETETPQEPLWEFESSEGRYRLTLRPAEPPVQIGRFQAWIVNVTTANGEPAYPARIAIGGGMQGHGHGLPTQPQITAYGGNGNYLVEGVRFSMEGQWRLSFQIESAAGNDRADVELDIAF